MKTTKHEILIQTHMEITRADMELLLKHARGHYRSQCQRAAEPNGLVKRIFDEFWDDKVTSIIFCLTGKDFDLLASIMEPLPKESDEQIVLYDAICEAYRAMKQFQREAVAYMNPETSPEA